MTFVAAPSALACFPQQDDQYQRPQFLILSVIQAKDISEDQHSVQLQN